MPLRSLQMRCPCNKNPTCVNKQGLGHPGRCRLRCTALNIGDTVNVYWSGEDNIYEGTIERINKYTVDIFYADGDREKGVTLERLRYPHTRPDTKRRQQKTKERHRQAAAALLDLEAPRNHAVAQHTQQSGTYMTIQKLIATTSAQTATISAQTATISAQSETISALAYQVEVLQRGGGKFNDPTLSTPATSGTAVGL